MPALLRCGLVALVGCLLWMNASVATAQQSGLPFINSDLHLLIDRYQTRGVLPGAPSFHRPLRAEHAQVLLDSLAAHAPLSPTEQRTIDRMRHEEPAPGARWLNRQWSALYPNGQNLIHASGDGYRVTFDPLYDGYVGPISHAGEDPRAADLAWRNTRGVRVAGHVGLIYFNTIATENQQQDLRNDFQINNGGRKGTAPRVGFVLQSPDDTIYDYFDATGIVGVGMSVLDIQFGRTYRHWGYGMNSLVLSNYASPHDQLQIQATYGAFSYTTMFSRFIDATRVSSQRGVGDAVQPRRYAAFHRLAFNASDRLSFGLFEATVFARRQSPGAPPKRLQASYLNPIMLIRTVESAAGGPHNVITGFDAQWRPIDGLSAYTQLALNDWSLQHLGTDHWKNQWAGLVGIHLAPGRASAWSMRLEGSRIRPFFYTGQFEFDTFAHYGDGIGHSAGPNSYDISTRLDYRPSNRWRAGLWYHRTWRGRGTEERNVGADLRRSTDTRIGDQATMLQGIRQVEDGLDVPVGYELLPALFVDAQLRVLRVDDAEEELDSFVAPTLGIRWGVPFQSRRF